MEKTQEEKDEAEQAVEQWKIKKLIKTLTNAKGCDLTSTAHLLPLHSSTSTRPPLQCTCKHVILIFICTHCLCSNGTSMISLIVPPKDQISRVSKMLGEELGTATNIKSRVNRLSVLGAITSVQQRLKLYNKVPPNGLVVYCGTVLTAEGKEKKVAYDFEPFKPINTSLYLCDNKFHTEVPLCTPIYIIYIHSIHPTTHPGR